MSLPPLPFPLAWILSHVYFRYGLLLTFCSLLYFQLLLLQDVPGSLRCSSLEAFFRHRLFLLSLNKMAMRLT